jgi:hypothetical protein
MLLTGIKKTDPVTGAGFRSASHMRAVAPAVNACHQPTTAAAQTLRQHARASPTFAPARRVRACARRRRGGHLLVIGDNVLRVRGVGYGEQQQRVGQRLRDGKGSDGVELLVGEYDPGRVADDGFCDGGGGLQGDAAPEQRRLAVFVDGGQVVGIRKREERLGGCAGCDGEAEERAGYIVPGHFEGNVAKQRCGRGEEGWRRGQVKLLLLRTKAGQRAGVVVAYIEQQLQVGQRGARPGGQRGAKGLEWKRNFRSGFEGVVELHDNLRCMHGQNHELTDERSGG